ncbi:hypothetical protein JTB14_015860 [Gonioctena quinquepunctata]|nr:hypothetical protein JTB14_015860 [Gonioctena quinquepunctata]
MQLHTIVYEEAQISLLDFILTNRLLIANVRNKPTFVTATRKEVLDISLSSEKACDNIANRHVTEKPPCSDHQIRPCHRSSNINHLPKPQGDKLG